MDDLLAKASEYRIYASTKCNAHFLAARISAKHHVRIGSAAILMNALIGTTVFAALDKKVEAAVQSAEKAAEVSSLYFLIPITAIAVVAAVLSSLQTFLNYSQRAELNRTAAVNYDRLRRKLDLFLLRYQNAPADTREIALKTFEEIIREFDETTKSSPPIADSLYEKARQGLSDRIQSHVDG